MFCDENYGDKRIVIPNMSVAGVIFIDAPHRLELWDTVDENIYYGWVPSDYSTDQIKTAVRFYREGFQYGETRSREVMQKRILDALGLFS